MTVPTVSICIPAYNCVRFVGKAIESVLCQRWQDFEIVVVDNASTDGTLDAVAAFADPRIRVYQNDENIGAAPNFNRAVSYARGRYLKVLCADDVIYPACLDRQIAILQADAEQQIAVVGCARDIIDEAGNRWLTRRFPGPAGRIAGHRAIGMTVRSGTNVFGEPAAILVRTETVRQIGAFNGAYSYCLDLDLWCRLLLGGDLYVLEESLCGFRISDQSWSGRLARRQAHEFGQFIDGLRAGGAAFPPLVRFTGRLRSHVNARLRQLLTKTLLLNSRTEK